MLNFIQQFFTAPVSYDQAALALRLVVGLSLLPYGIKKLSQISQPPKQFPTALGFSPTQAFYMAMTIESLCSLCLIFGLFTRLAAIPGICNMAVAYKVNHQPHFIAPSTPYLLGFAAILIVGPGAYSLDYLLF